MKLTWIGLNIFMIILMISIGGITRLTDSGLSMTEWNLISGILPPLNQNDWSILFSKYMNSPEFKLKNYDITLNEFKRIFFWEYFHRIWGRLIGLTFIIPLVFFWFKNTLSYKEKKFFSVLLFLGCFQAFVGWFMVKSGLVDKPDVSHFRLSAHLLIAFIIYSMLLYFFCINISLQENHKRFVSVRHASHITNIKISIFLVLITISSGAFVSGTNAGWAYNNFPFMGEGILPPILYEATIPPFTILFNDIGFLQFLHRVLATLTLIFVIYSLLKIFRSGLFKDTFILIILVSLVVISQYTLGIIILRLFVPIGLGLAHQLGSLILLSTLIITLCEIKKKRALTRPSV